MIPGASTINNTTNMKTRIWHRATGGGGPGILFLVFSLSSAMLRWIRTGMTERLPRRKVLVFFWGPACAVRSRFRGGDGARSVPTRQFLYDLIEESCNTSYAYHFTSASHGRASSLCAWTYIDWLSQFRPCIYAQDMRY